MSLVLNYLSLIYGIIAFLHIFNHWFENILSYLSVLCTRIWISKKVKTKKQEARIISVFYRFVTGAV